MKEKTAQPKEPKVPKERQNLFRKTQVCFFFQQGKCRYGNNCAFAHGSVETLPDLTKTSLCISFKKGRCALSSEHCRFAHGYHELRGNVPGQSPLPADAPSQSSEDNNVLDTLFDAIPEAGPKAGPQVPMPLMPFKLNISSAMGELGVSLPDFSEDSDFNSYLDTLEPREVTSPSSACRVGDLAAWESAKSGPGIPHVEKPASLDEHVWTHAVFTALTPKDSASQLLGVPPILLAGHSILPIDCVSAAARVPMLA